MGRFAATRTIAAWLVVSSAGVLAVPMEAFAQYFGRNKVEYQPQQFTVLRTEHFDIYYHGDDEQGARYVGQMAERWYGRLSVVLDHRFSDRQPLVLYSSHRDFAHTTILNRFFDDAIGGVTESLRRRILMPFAPGLGETNHVLGHEIVHAFQFDITRKHGTNRSLPLWVAEGMAEYLARGAGDPFTAMWVRDAQRHKKLPALRDIGRRGVSPYRVGEALWAYLGGRFGEGIAAKFLKTKKPRKAFDRLEAAAGVPLDELSKAWHDAMRIEVGQAAAGASDTHPLVTLKNGGRLNIAPALSPDGRYIAFLSERDGMSVDLFLADAATGNVLRKLATTAADPLVESLESVQSAGAWNRTGDRFVFVAVRRGVPGLTIVNPSTGRIVRLVDLPDLGAVLTPAFSPDAKKLVFSGSRAGFTDLYTYDLSTNQLQQLTNDPFADLHPSWSPDGTRIAFATDRFTSDLSVLKFGEYRVALLDTRSNSIDELTTRSGNKQIDPEWSDDGRYLFVVSDDTGSSQLQRVDVATGQSVTLTALVTGVAGLTASSPAISVAPRARTAAFSMLRNGAFEIRSIATDTPGAAHPSTVAEAREPVSSTTRADARAASLLADAALGLPDGDAFQRAPYVPHMTLQALVRPHFSSGTGRLGKFVRGGVSMFFADMLGERAVAATVQAGNRREDMAIAVRYVNRAARWNWGVEAELAPAVRGLLRTYRETVTDGETLVRETDRVRQFHTRVGGYVSYPFSRAQRVELSVAAHHIAADRLVDQRVFSLPDRDLLVSEREVRPAAAAVGFAELGAAIVHDTAVFGITSPIAGSRWRVAVEPSVGALKYTSVLTDYRRYAMPVRPYTVAVRLFHSARYGPDAEDSRLVPHFVGSRQYVRGYMSDAVLQGCRATVPADCPTLADFSGSRLAVGKLELRTPVLGALTGKLRYGWLPAEAFLFADAAIAWSGDRAAGTGRHAFRSVGAGVRFNAFTTILELAAARPLDGPSPGWHLAINMRPGF